MKRKIVILLLGGLFSNVLIGQTLFERIVDTYNSLDSISYIENVIASYKENLIKRNRESEDVSLKIYRIDYNTMDSIEKQKFHNIRDRPIEFSYNEELTKQKVWEEVLGAHIREMASVYLDQTIDSAHKRNIRDSISREFEPISMARSYSLFISNIKDNPAYFVLNLQIDSSDESSKRICLSPDTNRLPFNLFYYFGKHSKKNYFVYSEYGHDVYGSSGYFTMSRPVAKNFPKAFKRILRKKPTYLLFCPQLEGTNTILYVLNKKIYVYRITQMKKYELDDYINNVWHPRS